MDSMSLSHTAWDCKYHVGLHPGVEGERCNKQLREHLGEVFRKAGRAKEECRAEEGI